MAERRDTLKIIGAIGTTCAFPFSSDELYGQQQHEHAAPPQALAVENAKPSFFKDDEFETVRRLAEAIIPGAIAAAVPYYIDMVVNGSAQWKKLFREGLTWLDAQSQSKYAKPFRELQEPNKIELLTPLCAMADRSTKPASQIEVRFFKAFKGMTADGFFTSKIGLVDTLGYRGNTVLSEFPSCEG
ncbi:MAG: gluconate 2-dehydrogenase subunit 3 family protein [Candidatus Solibacter usitatus]|nr:gluconate 2-dehydrogenase subunit 3 family protein [Candidatus Solibacter usitatus]